MTPAPRPCARSYRGAAIRRVGLLAAAALAAVLGTAAGDEKSPYYNTYLGKQPPELTSDDSHWYNAHKALTLEELKGRPVWLQYNF